MGCAGSWDRLRKVLGGDGVRCTAGDGRDPLLPRHPGDRSRQRECEQWSRGAEKDAGRAGLWEVGRGTLHGMVGLLRRWSEAVRGTADRSPLLKRNRSIYARQRSCWHIKHAEMVRAAAIWSMDSVRESLAVAICAQTIEHQNANEGIKPNARH